MPTKQNPKPGRQGGQQQPRREGEREPRPEQESTPKQAGERETPITYQPESGQPGDSRDDE